MAPVWLVLTAVLGLLVIFLLFSRRSPRQGEPPAAGPHLPLFGAALAFNKDPVNFFLNCVQKYGKVFSVQLAGLEQVVLVGPEYPKLFFKAGDDVLNFNESLKALNFLLFMDERTLTFPIHIHLLKNKFTPNMKNWTPLIHEVIDQAYLDKHLQKFGSVHKKDGKQGQVVLKLDRFMAEVVARSSARCMCGEEGYDIDELISTFIEFDQDTVNLMTMAMLLPRFMHRFLGGRVKHHYGVMMKYLMPIVKKRRASGATYEDFLGYLLEAKEDDGEPLDDKWIVSRIGVMVWASITTTADSLTHAVLDIFSRLEIKKKVLEEQEQVLGSRMTIEHEDIKNMKYLEACIRESLRCTPFLMGPNRVAMQDIQAGEYTIPKGKFVTVSAFMAHKDPELWGEDVEEFKPERFLENNHPNYAFLPFGSGAHACPGRFFAMHEIKLLIAIFLRHYDIDLPGGRPLITYDTVRPISKQEPVIFTKLAQRQ